MPYDPDALAPSANASSGAPDALLDVQLEGAGGESDTLLRLARPRGGVVRVREFPALGAPREYDAPAGEVLARVEAAARARRRVGVELYALRRWLGA